MRPKPSGGVVPLGDEVAVRVELLRHHPHSAGPAVHVDTRVRLVPVGVPVGGEQGRLDRLNQRIERDVLVGLEDLQGCDVDIHLSTFTSSVPL